MSDVFICHVEEDATVALEIAVGLEEAGYATWCYELDSIPGASYLIQTGRAIEHSKAVIVVISPHSLGSNQVTKEVVRAHESGKHFIPVLRDVSHAEFQNRQPEWREAIGAATSIRIPQDGVANILARLIDGLRALEIHPRAKPDTKRIEAIRKVLSELKSRVVSGEGIELIPPTKVATEAKRGRRIKRSLLIALALVAIMAIIVVPVIVLGTGNEKQRGSSGNMTPTSTATPATTPKATPTPSSTPQWSVFAPDDFNDGTISPSWGLSRATGLNFKEDGVLTLEGNPNEAGTPGTYFRSTTSPRQDVTVMIDFRAPTGIQINTFCMFRVQFDSFNYFEIGIYKEGYALTRCMGPQVDGISAFLPLFGDETTKFHTLELSYKDDTGHIDAFIDDVQADAIGDKKFSASFPDFQFAFYVFSAEGQYIEREWDNFTSSGFTPAATLKPDDTVTFADLNLDRAIRKQIGKLTGDIRQSDLWGITELKATNQNIGNLTGLEYCTNMTILDLAGNEISDITPLSNLRSLDTLTLDQNQISDITPLSSLTNLRQLFLWQNQIVDISPVSSMPSLTALHLSGNKISDISPVSGLTNLYSLGLDANQIVDISPLFSLNSINNLWLSYNQIIDVSPLSNLIHLTQLYLHNNQITDISPLLSNDGLGNGDVVDLRDNPLSANSVNLYIPQLRQKGAAVSSN